MYNNHELDVSDLRPLDLSSVFFFGGRSDRRIFHALIIAAIPCKIAGITNIIFNH